MTVGKNRKFLKHAIDSIKHQTISGVDLLIGEDVVKEETTRILNILARRAKGEFLARMDSDDISEKNRFEKQVDFLRSHSQIKLIGSSAILIDESNRIIGKQQMLEEWEHIRQVAFFKNPLIHPSWMMRRKWFEQIGGYDPAYRYAQDWELILRRVWTDEIANHPDQLLRLRIHKRSISFQENRQQVLYGLRARLETLQRRDVPLRYGVSLVPSVLSLVVPTRIKFAMRSR